MLDNKLFQSILMLLFPFIAVWAAYFLTAFSFDHQLIFTHPMFWFISGVICFCGLAGIHSPENN